MNIEDAYLHYVDDTKRKWKELTLDEALGIGLTKWDKQVPDDLANVDLRVHVRVDDSIINYLRRVVMEHRWVNKGDIYRVITKHGMSIVSDRVRVVSELVAMYSDIVVEIGEHNAGIADELIFGSDTKFFLRENRLYSNDLFIRPVWWVYTGTENMSFMSNISKSDLMRYYIIASLATKFDAFKKRYGYYTECIDKQVFRVTNAITLACSNASELPGNVKKKILHILDKYKGEHNMDLYKKLKFMLGC